jgi:hypothetical protein
MYSAIMGESLRDGSIECAATSLKIHGYYFPWGTKTIRYGSIRELRRVDLGAFTGRARIWGTANPGYWANLDPKRPRKKVGLIIDCGRAVKAFITPDDPDAVERFIRERAKLGPAGPSEPGPII